MATLQPKDRRLFEHFVVAGLKDDAEHISPSSQECGCRNTQPLAPITDICVIFPGLGETVPEGFEIIDTTPLGYPADLNHGSLRVANCFLCFRRGYHKPPLVDIGVLDQGRGEKPMLDSNTVLTTPFGRSANVNNASQGVYLTYRRAQANSAPSQLVVTHMCVILANKGEIPPHTYYKISKNLNKGIVGSDVYICYKKSLGSSKRLAYKPSILDYFPKKEKSEAENEELNLLANVPLFCLPMGALIECLPAKCQRPEKQFSTFVLTDEYNTKYYGAAVTFYEPYRGELTDEQLEKLEIDSIDNDNKEGGAVEDSSSTNDPAEQLSFHTNVSICIVSKYPFFNAFKRFLFHIHRMSHTGTSHYVPIERYISHLMYEVSFPTPRRPRVLMQLGAETISFDSHDDSQLPLNGAALFDTLKCLGPDNLMYLMLLTLLEQKILIHSLRPWLLTAVAESVCALMFPFHWQCPYVPQCPLALAGVLHAPLPFIAGVDSRYFDLYEDPPTDVTCFDLDTSTISWSTIRQQIKLSLLPKKPAKQLKSTLENLYRKLSKEDHSVNVMQHKSGFVPVDQEIQIVMKRRSIEVGIQDAFLRFMSSIMRGYQSFLRPIVSAPQTVNATDTGNLFDLAGFLKTRDKNSSEFFKRFSSTQSFIRFIEERSFVSDKNAYNAFFDDCIAKVEHVEDPSEVSLLDVDFSLNSNHTVFIAPPEPLLDHETGQERQFTYRDGFPRHLELSLFQMDKLNLEPKAETTTPIEHEMGRCAGVRTKPEVRSSLLAATNMVRTQPLEWSKCLLFYAYSLWFMQLPSMLAVSKNKKKVLRLAFHVLDRIESTEIFPLDQICYRILIELCGQEGEPALAVKVLKSMRRTGLEQNAVTYGIYHRAVMNAKWPSETHTRATETWRRLRFILIGITQFRNGRSFKTNKVADNRYPTDQPLEHSHIKVQLGDDDDVEMDERLKTESCVISYHPLDTAPSISIQKDESDPLGAGTLLEEDGGIDKTNLLAASTMSPSRARFLQEHSSNSLFTQEDLPKEEKGKKSGNSWLRGLTNSPIIKMIRSQTMESMERKSLSDGGSDVGAISVSPSLQSLVTQVKKGYDEVLKDGGVSRIRLGVSSLVQEVKSLNRSYGTLGSGQIFGDEDDAPSFTFNENDPAFQMDSGSTGYLLDELFWIKDIFEDHIEENRTTDRILEVNLSSSTQCPHCKQMIYDEEIMAGWKVEDQNLNTECPFCYSGPTDIKGAPGKGVFAPRLHVQFKWKDDLRTSWYTPSDLNSGERVDSSRTSVAAAPSDLSVAFISPLVLRRELETLLGQNILSLKESSLKESHPVVFWNLIYYLRRLSLPSHFLGWLGSRCHIRCVYDRPKEHLEGFPLYLSNPNNASLGVDGSSNSRSVGVWKQVTGAVGENNMFKAIQALVNESRRVTTQGIALGRHFPIFRDIQFASLDVYGRALNRSNVDDAYQSEYERLPPRILPLLPVQDYPQQAVHRACRMIFKPLDLY